MGRTIKVDKISSYDNAKDAWKDGRKGIKNKNAKQTGLGINQIDHDLIPLEKMRHRDFQCHTNPMEMSDFEKKCAAREKHERMQTRIKYIHGIQGRDGGENYAEQDM